MKVLARSRYGAAKNCSGWARSDRQRPAAGAVAAGHSFRNRPTIIDCAITRVGKGAVAPCPPLINDRKDGGHAALCPPYDPPYAAFFLALISLRLIRHSAIWIAFSAAPLRKLSDTHHNTRPFAAVASSRMRLI